MNENLDDYGGYVEKMNNVSVGVLKDAKELFRKTFVEDDDEGLNITA